MQFFLQNDHLNGLLMGHKRILLFHFKRGPNSEILHRYIKFLFFIQFWCIFFALKWLCQELLEV